MLLRRTTRALLPRAYLDDCGCWADAAAAYQAFFAVGLAETAHEVNQRLASIVSNSGDAIVTKMLDGTITSWNDGAQRIFGYTAEEAVGRPVTMTAATRGQPLG